MKERKLKGKGTVTPLASVFPPEEAQKAANRIHDAIGEKKTELNSLLGFVNDNDNLVNLVQKLPEKLSHDIMVPFGKAAFFPGRLIHTNEFLVRVFMSSFVELNVLLCVSVCFLSFLVGLVFAG